MNLDKQRCLMNYRFVYQTEKHPSVFICGEFDKEKGLGGLSSLGNSNRFSTHQSTPKGYPACSIRLIENVDIFFRAVQDGCDRPGQPDDLFLQFASFRSTRLEHRDKDRIHTLRSSMILSVLRGR
jgi:hypothetical protein